MVYASGDFFVQCIRTLIYMWRYNIRHVINVMRCCLIPNAMVCNGDGVESLLCWITALLTDGTNVRLAVRTKSSANDWSILSSLTKVLTKNCHTFCESSVARAGYLEIRRKGKQSGGVSTAQRDNISQ